MGTKTLTQELKEIQKQRLLNEIEILLDKYLDGFEYDITNIGKIGGKESKKFKGVLKGRRLNDNA